MRNTLTFTTLPTCSETKSITTKVTFGATTNLTKSLTALPLKALCYTLKEFSTCSSSIRQKAWILLRSIPKSGSKISKTSISVIEMLSMSNTLSLFELAAAQISITRTPTTTLLMTTSSSWLVILQ